MLGRVLCYGIDCGTVQRPWQQEGWMARILVVDDEPLISAMTEEWLSELGHAWSGRRTIWQRR